jgi:SLA1 homology domain 1, SHD1/PEGA domain
MNAFFLTAAMFVLGAEDVQATREATTQLYIKTTPPGARALLDGKMLGKSDGLFAVPPGAHKLILEMDGYSTEERSIEVRGQQITRVEVDLKKPGGDQVVLSHVSDSSKDMRSFADSGFAVAFQRPAGMKSISAVKLFGARYGEEEPPNEDFHLYVLDQNQKVLEQIAVPYGKVERGELRWYTFEFPAIEVPEKFTVAAWFNAERTKGVYMGMDKSVKETHSFIGLPDKGFRKVEEGHDWMIRAVVTSEPGKKPTYPKVTTYEAEKPADTESKEALPTRTWNDATGAFSVEAQFAGVEDGKVKLKRADGKTVAVPLDRLSKEDQDFVAQQTGAAPEGAKPGKAQELSHDDGKMAGKMSMAGGGHAVRFQVEGDSSYVTSVSLHGSRYGEARPPKEDFNVWICDEKFVPIATFHFPYSSYARGEPVWKSFRIRPTRVPSKFIVCFGFNPHQTKGVYVSYDAEGSGDSLIGVPGKLAPKPFAKGDWLIRCKVENRSGGATSEK